MLMRLLLLTLLCLVPSISQGASKSQSNVSRVPSSPRPLKTAALTAALAGMKLSGDPAKSTCVADEKSGFVISVTAPVTAEDSSFREECAGCASQAIKYFEEQLGDAKNPAELAVVINLNAALDMFSRVSAQQVVGNKQQQAIFIHYKAHACVLEVYKYLKSKGVTIFFITTCTDLFFADQDKNAEDTQQALIRKNLKEVGYSGSDHLICMPFDLKLKEVAENARTTAMAHNEAPMFDEDGLNAGWVMLMRIRIVEGSKCYPPSFPTGYQIISYIDSKDDPRDKGFYIGKKLIAPQRKTTK